MRAGNVEEMTLQFEPEWSPLVLADVDSHETLGVKRSPADEERDHHSNCNHATYTPASTMSCNGIKAGVRA